MADLSDLERIAQRFRQELLRQERRAASEMVRYYGEAWKRIQAELDVLLEKIEQAEQLGEKPRPTWLYEMERLKLLRRQVEEELARFARIAESSIVKLQRQAVEAAQDHAEQMVRESIGEDSVTVVWNRLHTAAVEELVGVLQDGSPLRDLLMELGPEVGQGVADALVQGVILGLNPRDVARLVRRKFAMGLDRALRISRTETLRAYREAARRTYQANRHIVRGWIWHAALGPRSCASCIAMHGTFHTLNERLDSHPNCRCTMIPVTKPFREILGQEGEGWGETALTGIQAGEWWFDEQPPDVQARILGQSGLEAYEALKVDLRDFVGRKRDKRWGTMRFKHSLEKALKASGMPDVRWEGPRERAQPTVDVRRAIRILRDAGVDFRGIRIVLLGNYAENVDAPGWLDPNLEITLANNTRIWREVREKTKRALEQLGVSCRLPESAAERLAETLAHEVGHWLTVQRVGWYLDGGFSGAPRDLIDLILEHLNASGFDYYSSDQALWYDIGEVIAEDVRRILLGRDTRPNAITFRHDIENEDAAWKRARRVWKWLTAKR